MAAPNPRWSLRRARLLVGSKLALVGGLVVFVGLTWVVERMLALDGPVDLSPPLALVFGERNGVHRPADVPSM